jgi:oligosaccharide repeat unit polymerase
MIRTIYAVITLLAVGGALAGFPLTCIAAVIVAIVGVPLLTRAYVHPFSAWGMLFYFCIFCILLKSINIELNFPDAVSIDNYFLLGHSKDFLIPALLTTLIGMGLAVAGYHSVRSRRIQSLPSVFRVDARWNSVRVAWVCGVLIFISALALAAYVGIYGLDDISAKRGESDDLTSYRSHGYLLSLAGLSSIAFVIAAIGFVDAGRRRALFGVLCLLAASEAAFLALYSSSRGTLFVTVLQFVAIVYLRRSHRLPLITTALGLAIAVAGIGVISQLRLAKEIDTNPTFVSVVSPLVLNDNFIDVSKTAFIMDAIPDRLPYQWGRTYLLILIAWIPREVWPGKPIVNIDNTIGQVIRGHNLLGSAGLPAGQIAELYYNFSYPGIFAGCFLIGVLLRKIDVLLGAYGRNPNVVAFHALNWMIVGPSLFGSSFVPIFGQILFQSAFLFPCLVWMTPGLPAKLRVRPPRRNDSFLDVEAVGNSGLSKVVTQ